MTTLDSRIQDWLDGIDKSSSTWLYTLTGKASGAMPDTQPDDLDHDATPRQPRIHPNRQGSIASGSSLPATDTSGYNIYTASVRTASSSATGLKSTKTSLHPRVDNDRQPRTPSPSKRPHLARGRYNQSPSKRSKTTTSLAELERPVYFRRVREHELPADAKQLYQELFAVSNSEAVLPLALKDLGLLQETTRPFMWEEDIGLDQEAAARVYGQIKCLVDDSIDCANRRRSEAAYNAWVHLPTLRFLLEDFPRVLPEPVTSAQIARPFRPSWREANIDSSSSSSKSLSTVSSTSSATGTGGASTSAHKMVDLALVLDVARDASLAAAVDDFLTTQDTQCATVNQTLYEPLRRCPAPIFIETKTSAGNSEDGKVQLGVWIAAYYKRMRSIIERQQVDIFAAEQRQIITLPAIQWFDGEWTVFFATDLGSSIHVLDVDLRVGGTNSILGAYKLRKAVMFLAVWMETQFQPWFMSILAPPPD